jgi:hypothetical protein
MERETGSNIDLTDGDPSEFTTVNGLSQTALNQGRCGADLQRPGVRLEALRTMHVVDIGVGAEVRQAVIKRAKSWPPLELTIVNQSSHNHRCKCQPSDKAKIRCLIFNDLQG